MYYDNVSLIDTISSAKQKVQLSYHAVNRTPSKVFRITEALTSFENPNPNSADYT